LKDDIFAVARRRACEALGWQRKTLQGRRTPRCPLCSESNVRRANKRHPAPIEMASIFRADRPDGHFWIRDAIWFREDTPTD